MDPNQAKPNVYSPEKKIFSPMALIYVVCEILAVVLVFGVLNYFNILSLSKAMPAQLGWLPHKPFVTDAVKQAAVQVQPSPTGPTEVATPQDLEVLPLDPTLPDVYSSEIFYSAQATVDRLEQTGEQTFLHASLYTSKTALPPLLITPETKLLKGSSSNKSVDALPSDLKTGLTINLRLQYNIKLKSWILRQVFITEGSSQN